MPISSSRCRLTSPFVGTSSSTTSFGNKGASYSTMISEERTSTRENGTSKSQYFTGNQSTARKEIEVKLPVIQRSQTPFRQPLQAKLSAVVSKHGRRGRHSTKPKSHHGMHAADSQRSHSTSDKFALKKIRFFRAPPQPAPLTLCFSYPGYDLTHKDILTSIKRRQPIPIDKVQHIQFVDMNVVLGAAGVMNRWLITVKDNEARYRLIREGLYINGERVFLRRYDEVNFEDYRDYLRRKSTLQSAEHTAVQRLLSL
ncbi:uncharacterized protein [Diadema antillarum]|uniref:uncharacterized protein n=1 Tax=Diadema antillarum TaxID=105358 RepID=UPI003A8AF7BB